VQACVRATALHTAAGVAAALGCVKQGGGWEIAWKRYEFRLKRFQGKEIAAAAAAASVVQHALLLLAAAACLVAGAHDMAVLPTSLQCIPFHPRTHAHQPGSAAGDAPLPFHSHHISHLHHLYHCCLYGHHGLMTLHPHCWHLAEEEAGWTGAPTEA